VVRLQSEAGAATVEFVFVAIAMFMPFTWLVASAFTLHSAVLAIDDAARQGARAFSLAEGPTEAAAAGNHLANLVLREYRLNNTDSEVEFTCTPGCLHPAGVVRVDVTANVALPWVPPEFGFVSQIQLRAAHVEQIDFFRNTP
jgi:hypothetical protein